jgi:hypothetical protein
MTVYEPIYYMVVNGSDYTNITLDDVVITHGRQDVQDQPYAPSINFRCWSNTGEDLDFQLDDTIEFIIDNTLTQFYGYVSSINIGMTVGETDKNIVYYDIQALGALSQLSRTNTAGYTLPVQAETYRITDLLYRAFSLLWKDLGNAQIPSYKWQDYPSVFTWANFAPAYPGDLSPNISLYPTYTLSAMSATDQDTLTTCQEMANSSRGIMTESRSGQLTFYSYTDRTVLDAEITITSDMILTDTINSNMNIGDLVNVVSLEYQGVFPGTIVASDQKSIDLYGVRTGTKVTTLEYDEEAASMAADLVNARALPQLSIRSFTIPLQNDAISDIDRTALLQLTMNTGVIFPADLLPIPLKQPTDTLNFVEGWELRAKKNELYLTIYTSPRSYTYGHTLWLELQTASSYTWATYPSTTQWKDA